MMDAELDLKRKLASAYVSSLVEVFSMSGTLRADRVVSAMMSAEHLKRKRKLPWWAHDFARNTESIPQRLKGDRRYRYLLYFSLNRLYGKTWDSSPEKKGGW